VNNDKVSSPHTFTKGGSVYIPVWYVIQALNNAGIHSTWKGNSWYLTASGAGLSASGAHTTGNGNVSVYLNGKRLCKIPSIVALDPASHHNTTYLRVNDISNILKSVNIISTWNGQSWTLQTQDVKSLADAFANTSTAPQSQFKGIITEHVQLNVTDKAASGLGEAPTSIDMQMSMNLMEGTVHGERAMEATMTMTSSDDTSASQPLTIQEYVQGSRVWINEGKGWSEATDSEQLIQSLQSQLPSDTVSFNMLRKIHAVHEGHVTKYTASVDTSSLGSFLEPLMGAIGSSTGQSSGLTSSQMTSIVHAILGHTTGTLQVTVQPVHNKNVITDELLTLDINVPMSAIPVPKGDNTSMPTGISGFSVHETVTGSYSYDNLPVTPPAGVNTTVTSKAK
jgi:hypothetical protein